MQSRIFPAILIFCCLLVYFVFGSGWYAPSQLIVQGKVQESGTSLIVNWDSGAGYNDYEKRQFKLGKLGGPSRDEHLITIKRTGEKHPASLSSKIALYGIWADGKLIDLSNYLSPGMKLRGDAYRFLKKDSELQLRIRAHESLRIQFPTNNRSGKVSIDIDGEEVEHDLYTANRKNRKGGEFTKTVTFWFVDPGGRFTIFMDLPRYETNSLVIRSSDNKPVSFSSIVVRSEFGETPFVLDNDQPVTELGISGFYGAAKYYFDPGRFIFQVFFALLTTWIILSLLNTIRQCGGLSAVFTGEKRIIFWTFFFVSVACYTLWLIAFWPGVMSVDSLKIWRAARLPGVFLNDHPMLNVVFYMYLMQLWNNIAIVPITHVLLTSLLSASIFFWLYRRDVSLYCLLPFFLLLALSLPVGLYNLVLWKDIPFALLVVFWGYTMVRFYERKKEGRLTISFGYGVALILLWLALALFRHNGIVYLVYIPLLFLVLGFFEMKKCALVIGVIVVAGGMLFIAARSTGYINDANYLTKQGNFFLKQMVTTGIDKRIKMSSREYWGIFNINQKRSRWDMFHYYLKDRYAYGFLSRTGWNDSYPYLSEPLGLTRSLHDKAMQIYKASYTSPWIYFTWNPLYMLALFPLVLLLFPWFPRSAIYSSVFMVQVATLLVIVHTLNWRYYYFVYLGTYFLIPLMLLDFRQLLEQRQLLRGSNAF